MFNQILYKPFFETLPIIKTFTFTFIEVLEVLENDNSDKISFYLEGGEKNGVIINVDINKFKEIMEDKKDGRSKGSFGVLFNDSYSGVYFTNPEKLKIKNGLIVAKYFVKIQNKDGLIIQ